MGLPKRRRSLDLLLIACSPFVVVACSGSFDPSLPPSVDASFADGGTEASIVRPDGADANECNALEPALPAATPRTLAGAPPPGKGGTLKDGRFDLTAANVYGGASSLVRIQSAMEVDTGTFRMTSRVLGATSRLSGTYKTNGTRIEVVATCSNGLDIAADSFAYTSESIDVVKLYVSVQGRDVEYVFTRR
jgi:hypothetical protein